MKTIVRKRYYGSLSICIQFITLYCLFFNSNHSIGQELKVETLIKNFTANGAVSVDREGMIYVSEYGKYVNTGGNGSRVFKINPQGKILDTIAGLSGPMGTAIDSKGNLYINNNNNTVRGEILRISKSGVREVVATIDGWPSSMTIDAEDNLYISNYTAPTVHKITPDGQVILLVNDKRLTGGVGIDLDSKGNIIVSNFVTADIYTITPDGEVSFITNIPNIIVQNFGIGYITVIEDVIYATGIAVNYIFKVSMEGEIEILAGNGQAKQVDGSLKEASFSNPNGISSNKQKKILYISEYSGMGGLRTIKL
ncbi:SMP-30/gluconolactonase/LRE family protein [Aquimarina litoralis]|uniref:SMP-30/gluconolactonase/LRE family protein n=1 Tax=Aquimarina litoralis TaxID=584605 RepID=UPI001C592A61|nr:SMP-30/gluconolactonase/LRE family protein [Aquimarina litoralis]MBW1295319.1 hypothetical protein [Aquimarina litoralis]